VSQPEPIVLTVKRYKCPHCNRSRSARKATVEHMTRCWHNPAARGCRTCGNYSPAEDACGCEPGCNWGNGGEGIPEHCEAGVSLKLGPIVQCEKWKAA